jgi:hypothetical protein
MNTCTKEKLAEQVLRIINGGDINQEESLDSRDIQLYLSQAVALVVNRRFLEGKGMETGEVDGNMVLTFPDIEVEKDSMGYYAILPSCTVGLMEGRGIHEVGDKGGVFIPAPNGFSRNFECLDSITLQGSVGYFPEDGKVRFFNVENFDDHVVYMKLTAAFDGIEEDRVISIPLDIQNEIVSTAVSVFSQTPQVDKVTDNIDDEV